ncbi:DNA polymerase lambda isoform X1 [Neocloeon triangulifer]|uniref:DNA polymerase lambda isoform X1 n=1 Tax=Neocloeon triangulifer TaxID=2078957 RepID=UPI00286FAEC3|nr:DNA polymerase lambda isoform X1 [Neocloeon triangulifer]
MQGPLDGARVFIFPEGLGKKRRALFAAQIARLGGRVAPHPRGATHLVLEAALDASRPPPEASEGHLVSTRWLSECIKQQKLVPEHEFLVRVGKKRAAPEPCETPREVKVTRSDSPGPSKAASMLSKESEASSEPNLLLITELKKLADAYRNSGDQWRNFAYTKAISAIKCYKKPIKSYQEALALPGLGEKMASKVWELLETGQLQKTGEVCGSEQAQVLALFNGVWGVGPSTAQTWYAQGYRTLEDLRSKATLSRQQAIGLKFFTEINSKIPRAEVEEIAKKVEENAKKLEPDVWVETCGSFRRGKPLCGDIDIVLSLPEEAKTEDFLQRLLTSLKESQFLTDDLSGSHEKSHKFMGICRSPSSGVHRRLDLFVVPWRERAFALVHYTGSAHFNRSLRRVAIKKNMVLSDHALVGPNGNVIPANSEKDVFEALGVAFRAPEDREHALEVLSEAA